MERTNLTLSAEEKMMQKHNIGTGFGYNHFGWLDILKQTSLIYNNILMDNRKKSLRKICKQCWP